MFLPLKVLHVANLSMVPKGAGFFGVPFKISNGLVRAGHHVLNFVDRDVARASTVFRSRAFGVLAANRKLVEVARDFVPDLVLFGHADIIRPETLPELRDAVPGVRLAQWNVDPLFEDDNIARLNAKIALVDWTFVSTAGAQLVALGQGKHPVSFLPNPVDPSIERARNFERSKEELGSDVFFAVGNPDLVRSHAGVTAPAGEIVARLRRGCPGLRFATPGCGGPPVFGDGYERLLADATMGLNISRRNDAYLYSSDRLAHMAGSGMLVFIDRATGYDGIFGEDDFAFYSSEPELFDRLRFFNEHDDLRRAMARRGWEAYRRVFDCRDIAAYLVDVIMGTRDAKLVGW